ncbi:HD domain-containing protein [bacterium]|nr:HD domain-containing protein [bacterium]
MFNNISVNFGNFLLSLSDMIDLASPTIAAHQMRTAYIAWQISLAADFSSEMTEDIYKAAILHDIGALSPEDKIKLQDFEETNLIDHCIIGKALFLSTPLLKSSADIVRGHHTPINEFDSTIENPVVMAAQVLFLSDYVERIINKDVYILFQVQTIKKRLKSDLSDIVHNDVLDIFFSLCIREEFWLDLASAHLYSFLLNFGPLRTTYLGFEDIVYIGVLFRSIIDFRSPYTATHSTGVAESAYLISKKFGLTDTESMLMRLAGDFHDLGKLAVPNSILNKPSRLTREEFLVIKQHTYHTFKILNTIGGFSQIAKWSAFHHERLDGNGYPFRIKASELDTGSRIMAVADIFTALAENRPYRKRMKKNQIIKILTEQKDKNMLDSRIVELLFDNYDEIDAIVKKQQAISEASYLNFIPESRRKL